MNAHLIETNGHILNVTVPANLPRIVRHNGAEFALDYPGFAYFDGGEYVQYREAIPQQV